MSKCLIPAVVVVALIAPHIAGAAPQEKQDGATPQAAASPVKAVASDAVKPATPAAADPKKSTTVKAPVKPPEKVGLARLDADWPKWLTVTFVDRSRVEAVRPPATKGADYDGYFLNRFRLTALVKPASWLSATVQTQDARVAEYSVSPAPKNMQNPFDLRQAYVEFARKGTVGVTASAGRQELTFADGRLMASPDWGNVSRTYDAVRVAAARPGVKVEVFGGAPVDVTPDAFSRAKYGERFAGTWVTFDRVKPLGYVEAYEIGKHNSTATAEGGSKGDQTIYTTGVRAGGPIARTIAWEMDTAFQRGHSAVDSISAWGTHEGVSWTIGRSAFKPKVGVEYNYATGDNDAKDGTKQTFDQLYASTHAKWGLGDNVAWRNMQHMAGKFEFAATARLKINTALNYLQLATVNDAWYGSSGSKIVTNKKATSRTLGWEPDLYGTYTVTKDLTVGLGMAVLFAGDFVKQSTDLQRLWTPYVMWTYKF